MFEFTTTRTAGGGGLRLSERIHPGLVYKNSDHNGKCQCGEKLVKVTRQHGGARACKRDIRRIRQRRGYRITTYFLRHRFMSI